MPAESSSGCFAPQGGVAASRERRDIAGVGKKEIKNIPLIGKTMELAGTVFIDRANAASAIEAMQPLVATVSFMRGKVKAFETAPMHITEGLDPKSRAVPLKFSVPLGKLVPGRYTVQVSVLDPAGQKFAFWRAPMVVVPARNTTSP